MTPPPITPWSANDAAPTALQPAVPQQALQPLIDGAPLACSPTVGAIAGALAQAQADVGNPAKNARNPHFKSNYADLAALLSVVRPALSAHGLALLQVPITTPGGVAVVTVLAHESGEWIGGRLFRRMDAEVGRGRTVIQEIGSIITYLRRYAAASMVGVAQEDDDGNSDAGRGNGSRSPLDTPAGRAIRAKADEAMPRLSPDQAAAVNAAVESAADIAELRRVEKKLDATLAALDANVAPASNGTAGDGWVEAVPHKIGEDGDGNPEYGAVIAGAAAAEVPPGTKLKIPMRRGGKMRAVVTEVIEQTMHGVIVRTRRATAEEEKA